jgi:predicted transposase YbfD/YdcC
VCRIRRERELNGQKSVETVYAITSLSRQRADARQLLEVSLAHWGIENRLFCVRDVTFHEDQCRVRHGSGPQVLAAARNTSLTLIRTLDYHCVPEAREYFAEHRSQAVRLVRHGTIK